MLSQVDEEQLEQAIEFFKDIDFSDEYIKEMEMDLALLQQNT